MTEQNTYSIEERLDYMELVFAQMWTGDSYLSYEEFLRKMPNGPPAEVTAWLAAGKRKMAIMQLVKSCGVSMPAAQVIASFLESRQARG
jgi:hypothetical protein